VSNEIIIALLSLVGTVIGSGLGVIASSRLTNYRIQQLEKKVEKHNSVVERMAVAEKEIRVANHRIEDLERKMEHEY
jgi:tetrahydromethanopterin S-methyltransferase subunit G